MPRLLSAYAALELEPGADREAVEAAYRRLIKLHHPDRSGGDGKRAAEINRAYFELRSLPAPASVPIPRPRRRKKRRNPRPRALRWSLLALALVPLVLMQSDLIRQAPQWAGGAGMVGAPLAARSNRPGNSELDGPVDGTAVTGSVGDAFRLVKAGDDSALAEHSRGCHRRMRAEPKLSQLDRCAAFDSAVVALEDRDPSRDTGPFNVSSVTARQMTAASLLSNDFLAIERRLNRIRSEVELALMPSPTPRPAKIVVETERVEIEP